MLILAGGLGTRIRSLYPDRPKAIIPTAGYPFLVLLLTHYAAQGIEKFVILTGYLAERLEAELSQWQFDASIEFFSEPALLGTGGAVLRCAENVDVGEIFMVANGDSMYPGTVFPDEESHLDWEATVFGVQVDDASNLGSMQIAPDGRLIAFREKQRGTGIANGGVYIFRKSFLDRFPRRTPLSMEHDVFPHALKEGAVIRTRIAAEALLDIGTPESLGRASQFFEKYPVRRMP
jgi:NDP-sugar pyrophosphorylase family protein